MRHHILFIFNTKRPISSFVWWSVAKKFESFEWSVIILKPLHIEMPSMHLTMPFKLGHWAHGIATSNYGVEIVHPCIYPVIHPSIKVLRMSIKLIVLPSRVRFIFAQPPRSLLNWAFGRLAKGCNIRSFIVSYLVRWQWNCSSGAAIWFEVGLLVWLPHSYLGLGVRVCQGLRRKWRNCLRTCELEGFSFCFGAGAVPLLVASWGICWMSCNSVASKAACLGFVFFQ